MTEEFLKELGIPEAAAEKILAQSQTELAGIQLDYAVRGAVEAQKPKNLDVALSLLDREGLAFQDGAVDGLEERVEALRAEHAYLFSQDGGVPRIVASASGGKTGISAEQFARMGYQDRVRLYRQNPELYKALTGNE